MSETNSSAMDAAATDNKSKVREDQLEIYVRYQQNAVASAQLRREILLGAKADMDYKSLFLKAAKALSLVTDNELFYTQIVDALGRRGE
jgi:hypothetical protein